MTNDFNEITFFCQVYLYVVIRINSDIKPIRIKPNVDSCDNLIKNSVIRQLGNVRSKIELMCCLF